MLYAIYNCLVILVRGLSSVWVTEDLVRSRIGKGGGRTHAKARERGPY